MQLNFEKYELEFIKPAITSRGAYTAKNAWILTLSKDGKIGVGEASPLPDLSIDGKADIDSELHKISDYLADGVPIEIILSQLKKFPSVQFALECAYMGVTNSRNNIIFDSPFTRKAAAIQINGLVWMSDVEEMYRQAEEKIEAGFTCIKFKVGAHDHDAECRLIEKIRKKHSAFKLEIRLDANGAYLNENVYEILKDFGRFELHSMEQPIKAGQWEMMGEICAKSKLDIAVDEELIGVDLEMATTFLKTINPKYIILKPTLLGGFKNCDFWISQGEKYHVEWWATSALEGNIGLGHIAEWVATKNNKLYQGLGTGALYKNNFESNTFLEKDMLWFGKKGI